MTELIFMYGFPASGKTTFAKNLVATHPEKDYVYLAADDIRKELYGSQDKFGTPEDIYFVLLSRMLKCLKQGRSVIYDACNLYRQFRMDYLTPVAEAGIECYKTLIRLNTTRETCLENHKGRGRNFDIEKISHYFDINEFPRMDEGWDYIYDIPDHKMPGKRFYLASPFFGEKERTAAIEICEHFRALGTRWFCRWSTNSRMLTVCLTRSGARPCSSMTFRPSRTPTSLSASATAGNRLPGRTGKPDTPMASASSFWWSRCPE